MERLVREELERWELDDTVPQVSHPQQAAPGGPLTRPPSSLSINSLDASANGGVHV